MEHCRGDIYYVNRTNIEVVGSEMIPGRPALIVSSDLGNEHSNNVTVVYLTTQEKRPMAVHVNVLCKVPCTAMCEQIYTVSKDRLGEFVRSCTDDEMQRIDQGIRYALALQQPAPANQDENQRIKELEALLEAEKGNVSVLRNNLKEKDAIIKAKDEVIKKKDERIDGLAVDLAAMELELDQAEEAGQVAALGLNKELIQAQAERDVYKAMFLQLQAKMMERRA